VLLNQMGADFHQILPQITQLILLTVLYGATALLLLRYKLRRFSRLPSGTQEVSESITTR